MQREQRQKNDNDDKDAENNGTADFFGGVKHEFRLAGVRMLFALIWFLSQMAMDVFHHHDCPVHHHADADGQAAKRHKIGAQAIPLHHNESKERGQRENKSHDDGAPQIREQHDENDEHENRALSQRLRDRVNRLSHQIGAVVKRNEFDAFGQCFLNRGQSFLDGVDDISTTCTFEHENNPSDCFAAAVGGHRPLPQFRTDSHIGHIAHINRRVVVRGDNDVFDVADAFHQS